MLNGCVYLIWQTLPYLAMKASRKSPSPMLCQRGYRDIVQVLAISSAQVPVGRRINFEFLAFASKAILRQNMSDPAICRLCLSFPPNNSNILENGLIIPLTRRLWGDSETNFLQKPHHFNLQQNLLSCLLIFDDCLDTKEKSKPSVYVFRRACNALAPSLVSSDLKTKYHNTKRHEKPTPFPRKLKTR